MLNVRLEMACDVREQGYAIDQHILENAGAGIGRSAQYKAKATLVLKQWGNRIDAKIRADRACRCAERVKHRFGVGARGVADVAAFAIHDDRNMLWDCRHHARQRMPAGRTQTFKECRVWLEGANEVRRRFNNFPAEALNILNYVEVCWQATRLRIESDN